MAAVPSHEVVDARFRSFVLHNAPFETLASEGRWLEGPVWFADHQMPLFSDVPNDRVLRWSASGGVSVFRAPAGFPNGHTRDREGRLVGCSHGLRALMRSELDGTLRVLDDFDGPNGLCFSPDERRLDVAESGTRFSAEPERHLRVFDLAEDGARLCNGHVFHRAEPGYADGFRCDSEGNVWTGAGDGVHCIDPSGALLGKIFVPHPVANLGFGGRLRSTLFLCAGPTLHAIAVNRRGCQAP